MSSAEAFHKAPKTFFKDEDSGKVVKSFKPDPKDVEIEESDDETYLWVPVSSTNPDRDGDRIDNSGVQSMIQQYKTGEVAYYEDHGLSPETGWQEYRKTDMQGRWVDAKEEEEIVYAKLRLQKESHDSDQLTPENEETVDMIKQGDPVGFSIGFIPLQYDDGQKLEEDAANGMVVNELDLMETSSVGIPSNPDAVNAGMAIAKGLDEKGVDTKGMDTDKVVKGLIRLWFFLWSCMDVRVGL